MSGKVGTKKIDPPDAQMDNLAKSDDQDQRRVKFDVVETAQTCELNSWRVKHAERMRGD